MILAGGSGTRFWPLSRESHPKQLLNITGSKTLIQETLERLRPIIPPENLYIVSQEAHAYETCTQLGPLGFPTEHLIAEPVGRNTAPAVALASQLIKHNPDEVMAVFPADHVIRDQENFLKSLKIGEAAARQGHLVTLGIRPTSPATGYGYIQVGDPLPANNSVHKVERFIEKPERKVAENLLRQGGHLWNAGMFLWKVSSFMDALKQFLPEVDSALSGITKHFTTLPGRYGFQKLDKEGLAIYDQLPSISIDHGIMEMAKNVVVVPCEMGWSDVGSWDALEGVLTADERGNVVTRNVYLMDGSGNIVLSNHRLIATLGVDNLVIVDTPDALLVCPKDRAQDVRKLVGELREQGREEVTQGSTVHKPWGSYTVLSENENYLVKRIDVHPGQKLSLQSHQHREEHWVVAHGRAEVQVDDTKFQLETHQSTTIPKGAKHRLGNPGPGPLTLIETQLGTRLDESDITRYEDLYGRTDANDSSGE